MRREGHADAREGTAGGPLSLIRARIALCAFQPARVEREINVTGEQTACPAVLGIDALVYELP